MMVKISRLVFSISIIIAKKGRIELGPHRISEVTLYIILRRIKKNIHNSDEGY
jgi:hypothetical protein